MTDVDRLAERYVDEFAALDPCLAAMMGIAGQEASLTDYSPDGFAARTALARRTRTALDAAPAGDDASRIAAQVLRDRLEVDLELAAAGIPDADLNTLDGPLQRLGQAIELLDRGTETPWEALHARIAALPGALAGHRQSLTRACQDGRVAARRQVASTAAHGRQLTGYLAGLPLAHGDGPLRGDLDRAVRAAGQALEDFARFLDEELVPHAPVRDGLGRDRYALEVRNHLGTRLDLEETYAWGWEELARVEADMAATAERIRPGEPLEAVTAALDADPAHRITGAENFRAWLQDLADQAIDALDGVHFDIPAPLRQVECRIPANPSGVYYLAPAEDLSRPGTVWWTVRDAAEPIVTWTVPATMFHEGAPGHHLQLGATVVNTATLNRFQRVCGELYPGHCEGWGLYAERLMAELGFYPDPAHYLGMLAGGQQLRAARVVLDIGMHLELPIPAGTGFHEGQRWNRDLGWEFLRAHCGPETDSHVDFEIDRYLGRPGQALAYKVGEKVWLDAREAARRAAGDAFDLKEFHRRALDLGPMGLDLLRRELTPGQL